MNRTAIILVSVAAGAILFFGSLVLSSALTKNWIASLQWDNPSLADIPDGAYTAEYTHTLPAGLPAQLYGVKLIVRVFQHKYYNFIILEPNKNSEVFQPIIEKVLAQQTLKPDGMAGASVTNSAFLIAVSKAMVGARVIHTGENADEADNRHDPDAPALEAGAAEGAAPTQPDAEASAEPKP
jgi:uncharacterized protein with FMN-binding domain